MTDLTEQWKKGKLPFGYYYVKFLNGKEGVKKLGEYAYRKLIKEVIDIVPSYEEWQRVLHYAGKYEFEYTSCAMDYENLKEENTKLKELLKECKPYIALYTENNKHIGFTPETANLLQQINQALGENK